MRLAYEVDVFSSEGWPARHNDGQKDLFTRLPAVKIAEITKAEPTCRAVVLTQEERQHANTTLRQLTAGMSTGR